MPPVGRKQYAENAGHCVSVPLNAFNVVKEISQLPKKGMTINSLDHSGMKLRVVLPGKNANPPEMLTVDKVNMAWVIEKFLKQL